MSCAKLGTMNNRILIALILVLVAGNTLSAQSKEDDIRKLLVMTGSADLGIQMMDYILASYTELLPEIPLVFFEEIRQVVSAESLIDIIVPIYDRHFTHEEIKDVIAFYNTPTGQKFIFSMPSITSESMAAGEAWGAELGRKIYHKLVDDGYVDS